MKSTTKSRLLTGAVILLIIGLFLQATVFYNPKQLTNSLKGSYAWPGAWLSISQDEETFYLTDLRHDRHIRGHVEDRGDHLYFLSCEIDANRAYFEDQEVVFHPFRKALTINFNGRKMTVPKTDEGTVLEGGYEYH